MCVIVTSFSLHFEHCRSWSLLLWCSTDCCSNFSTHSLHLLSCLCFICLLLNSVIGRSILQPTHHAFEYFVICVCPSSAMHLLHRLPLLDSIWFWLKSLFRTCCLHPVHHIVDVDLFCCCWSFHAFACLSLQSEHSLGHDIRRRLCAHSNFVVDLPQGEYGSMQQLQMTRLVPVSSW